MTWRKVSVNDVLYRWDGDRLIAETTEGYVNVGFAIQNLLEALDDETTDMIGAPKYLLIGDHKNIYRYDPEIHAWMGFTRQHESFYKTV